MTRYEVEQKFPVDDLSAIEVKLGSFDARWKEPIRQLDFYFAHPARDFAETDEAFRIRCVAGKNFVTYKGPRIGQTTKTRREIELPLSDGEDFAEQYAELFEALGFTSAGEVRKTRRRAVFTWQGRGVEAALDQVDELGSFVEIEMIAEDSTLDATTESLLALAAELGLTGSERRSYLELILDAKR
jgi:adenylate cyclase class 2